MPSWSGKDRRMYEHVKESEEARGVDEERAEEIAARTVDKQRREEGRTPNRTTQGTGNPDQPLGEHTRDELYNIAREMEIEGRSGMNKEELVRAIEENR